MQPQRGGQLFTAPWDPASFSASPVLPELLSVLTLLSIWFNGISQGSCFADSTNSSSIPGSSSWIIFLNVAIIGFTLSQTLTWILIVLYHLHVGLQTCITCNVWGSRGERQETSFAKFFECLFFEKFFWNKETKILDDVMTGDTEVGFVQLSCLHALLVAFTCMLMPSEMKFWAYAFMCDMQKWADLAPFSGFTFLAECQLPSAK